MAVTRVVGRIPDVPGESDPAMLLAALDTAATYTQRAAGKYQKVFSLSAAVWKGSTTTSVDLLPGPAPTTHLTPPEDAGWTKRGAGRADPLRQLPRRRHHAGLVRPGAAVARSTPSR